MAMPKQDTDAFPAMQGLEAGDSSARLRAVLALGTSPDPRFIDKLIERCAIEPEFSVRDMLTWALTRHPASMTDPDPRVRAHAIATEKLLRDPDAGVAFAIEEAKRVVALGGTGEGVTGRVDR